MSGRKRPYGIAGLIAAIAVAGAGFAFTTGFAGGSGDDNGPPSAAGQLDDGEDLLPQAGITLDAAIAAAQGSATGAIGEVDLEHYQGKLVFNVDVGAHDVKVDASNGAILAADQDD